MVSNLRQRRLPRSRAVRSALGLGQDVPGRGAGGTCGGSRYRGQRLCPYQLAEEHGTDVYSLEELAASGCPQQAIDYFTSVDPEAWSAALVPNGTGRFIVENTVHLPRRRRSNVAHEMARLLLEHEFDRVLFTDGKRGCRNPATREMEEEAAELSGELLLPAAAAARAAVAGKTDEQVGDLSMSVPSSPGGA